MNARYIVIVPAEEVSLMDLDCTANDTLVCRASSHYRKALISAFALGIFIGIAIKVHGQSVSYELTPSSKLTHSKFDAIGNYEEVVVGLQGTLEASVKQGDEWIELDFFDISVESIFPSDYQVAGTGSYGLVTFLGKGGSIGAYFVFGINEFRDLDFTSNCGPECQVVYSGRFPRISFNVFQLDVGHGLPREYFTFYIEAFPRAPDGSLFFRRGDFDGGGSRDISDVVAMIDFMFLGGAEPSCLDAADTNDDGAIDLADPVALLGTLFLKQAPLPPPMWICGIDTTDDPLGCLGQTSCMPARP